MVETHDRHSTLLIYLFRVAIIMRSILSNSSYWQLCIWSNVLKETTFTFKISGSIDTLIKRNIRLIAWFSTVVSACNNYFYM